MNSQNDVYYELQRYAMSGMYAWLEKRRDFTANYETLHKLNKRYYHIKWDFTLL